MSSAIDKLVDTIKETTAEAMRKKTQPFDTMAKVTRVEDDTLWVHIEGGVDETPIKRTIDAKVGEDVQVRIAGGTGWAVGNGTSPPTDDTMAIQANEHALTAQGAANSAVKFAGEAQEAAGAANEAAQSAKDDADKARKEAIDASKYASSALLGLSQVQDVVGTLEWNRSQTIYKWVDGYLEGSIKENKNYYKVTATYIINPSQEEIGTYYTQSILEDSDPYYISSIDMNINPNKEYYTLEFTEGGLSDEFNRINREDGRVEYIHQQGGEFQITWHLVTNPKKEKLLEYYEYIPRSSRVPFYKCSLSDVINENIRYYTLIGELIENPSNDELFSYYVIDEKNTMSDYINSHLALTDSGLYILALDNDWKVKISNKDVSILDPYNNPHSVFGEEILLGTKQEGTPYLEITNSIINFLVNNIIKASLGYEEIFESFGLTAENVFLKGAGNALRLDNNLHGTFQGQFILETRQNGHLSLKPGLRRTEED